MSSYLSEYIKVVAVLFLKDLLCTLKYVTGVKSKEQFLTAQYSTHTDAHSHTSIHYLLVGTWGCIALAILTSIPKHLKSLVIQGVLGLQLSFLPIPTSRLHRTLNVLKIIKFADKYMELGKTWSRQLRLGETNIIYCTDQK